MLKTSPSLAASAKASPAACCRRGPPASSPSASPRSCARLAASGFVASPQNVRPNSPSRPRPQTPSVPQLPRSSGERPWSQSPGADAIAAAAAFKRRSQHSSSPSGRLVVADASTADQQSSCEASSKRPKANDPPPRLLPRRYELCAVVDVVELVAHMLAELIATNDAIPRSSGGLTRFHSRTPPGISVRDYLHRLARHATLTPPLLLAMVYYIDRLCALYQDFTINTLTVHRFLITAATVAAKGLSDSFWNNKTYARVGGVRVAELKLLELEFLYRVDWKIVPDPEVLVAYYRGLVERAPGYALESLGGSGGEADGMEEDEDDDDDDDEITDTVDEDGRGNDEEALDRLIGMTSDCG
ncbi:hypothetical protein CDD80_2052 [Ophiocordyceps camponoti-rufipedis]|uniref:Nuc-1 negative regulatory protein preg n=1 Tax=Ophiocordyceps camponoti-rufipedis TaxID=2004952 RepID=A0A2C5Z7H7_9HYPO|nr:hypothetical protein CDD80_2052 [Ophiocordyceps camponoti-rufipedis]